MKTLFLMLLISLIGLFLSNIASKGRGVGNEVAVMLFFLIVTVVLIVSILVGSFYLTFLGSWN